MNKLDLNKLSREAYDSLIEYGLRDDRDTEYQIVNWAREELSEARKEWERKEQTPFYYYKGDKLCTDLSDYSGEKPQGVAIEMVDFIWTLLAWFEYTQRVDLNLYYRLVGLPPYIEDDVNRFERYIDNIAHTISSVNHVTADEVNATMALKAGLLYFEHNSLDFFAYLKIKQDYNKNRISRYSSLRDGDRE